MVVGGLDSQEQAKQLERRPHVVIATPGRLKALIDGNSTLAKSFQRTAFLILDEADRLLDESFEEDLATILECLPGKRQTLLFSATMTRALVTLQQELLDDAFVFEAYEGLQTATGLRETVTVVPAKVGGFAQRVVFNIVLCEPCACVGREAGESDDPLVQVLTSCFVPNSAGERGVPHVSTPQSRGTRRALRDGFCEYP